MHQQYQYVGLDVSLESTLICHNRDLGIARVNVRLPPANPGEIMPLLDRWAKLIRQLGVRRNRDLVQGGR